MTTFALNSCKGNKAVECESLGEAIAHAIQMEAELQPAFGVVVEDTDGKTVAHIVDGIDLWE